MSEKKKYVQKFKSSWMEDPDLRKWISPSKYDSQSAYCVYCDKHLTGSKTLMLRHATRPKHIEKMKMRTLYNVKLVTVGGSECIVNEEIDPEQIIKKTKANSNKKDKESNFVKDWLKDPLLRPWISPSNKRNHTAYCNLCDYHLSGKKTSMLKHARSSEHIKNTKDSKSDIVTAMADTIIVNAENENEDVNSSPEMNADISYVRSIKTELDSTVPEAQQDIIYRDDGENFDLEDDVSCQSKVENGRHDKMKSKSNVIKLKKKFKKSFFDSWLVLSAGKVPYCKICKLDIRGGKKYWIRHSETPKHIKEAKSIGLCTEMIPRPKFYPQKFASAWKLHPLLKSWIAPSSVSTAFCEKCNRHLSGSKTQMLRHAVNHKHIKNLQRSIPRETLKNSEIHIIAFVVQHNLPLEIINSLPELVRSVAPDSDIAKKVGFKEKSLPEEIIRDVFSNERLSELSGKLMSCSFSLILDVCSDMLMSKSIPLVVRYYDEQTSVVEDSFLQIIDVDDDSSETFLEKFLDFFSTAGVSLNNLLGFAADACDQFMGKYSVFQNNLQSLNPYLYVSGCNNKSFYQCGSVASQKLPRSMEQLCHDICNYIQDNPNQIGDAELQAVTSSFHGLKADAKLNKVSWLVNSAIVLNITEKWDKLITYFSLTATHFLDSTAETIVMHMSDPISKLYFLFLNFFLPLLDDLNLEFQSTKYCLHSLLNSISDKMKMILKYYMKPTYVNETPLTDMDPANDTEFKLLEDMYFGSMVDKFVSTLDPSVYEERIITFKTHCLEFYLEFCNQLIQRVDYKDQVLKYLYILNPSICKSDLYVSIKPLAVLFPNIIDPSEVEKLELEWWDIKAHPLLMPDEDFLIFWNKVFRLTTSDGSKKFPLTTKFVKAMMCLPHFSEAAEKIFISVNENKNKPDGYSSEVMSNLLLTRDKFKQTKFHSLKQPPE